MRVLLQFGSRAGDVVDILPHEARAMLADGRALLPPDDEGVAAAPPVGVAMDRMADPADRDPAPRATVARRRRR